MIPMAGQISLAHILPPAFIISLAAIIWFVHVFLHLIPMLQLDVVAPARVDAALQFRGWWELFVSQSLTLMLVVCYIRCVVTHPGTVPDSEEWTSGMHDKPGSTRTFELKLTGQRRHCKWCKKYKPDRCHHCRVCKTCVLKMDHHCPWIMNCVGFQNHKFFFLLVIYSVLDCAFISCVVVESVLRTLEVETPSMNRFLLVFCFVLSSLLFLMTGCFLAFHTWLLFSGMTTIEFCEKNLPEVGMVSGVTGKKHDHGALRNMRAVFGSNPLLWMLPVQTLEGDGVSFPRPVRDVDAGDGIDPEWTGGTGVRWRVSEKKI